ncbi:MAG: aminoacetone oxidase family FAD-binding enzyme [Erysipelotrichales bacterium]|nr:aminoacetone oxidase family FAD-binding enzyme [Erysipelotrichales bacterium]
MTVGIIGGGASGLIAALKIKTSRPDIKVTIIEKENALGKKIKVSGNGRCNLGNRYISDYSYNKLEISKLVREKNYKFQQFLEDIGLLIKEDNDGRLYPFSESAQMVVQLLTGILKDYNTEIKLSQTVTDFGRRMDKFFVKVGDSTQFFDYLIIATGGKSYFKYENSDVLNNVFLSLGIKTKKILPGLSALKTIESPKILSGLRLEAKVKLLFNEEKFYEEQGEVQFKDDGLSGIVIMNIASVIARSNKKPDSFKLSLDLSAGKLNEISDIYNKTKHFQGILPEKLLNYFKAQNLEAKGILRSITETNFKIADFYPIKEAQVSVGGLDLTEIDLETMMLKKVPGLFVTGEILDVDGLCGGYNLMFAFLSGLIAAEAII